nr:MAG TPA: hypothetical protein [Caudoviricetes sp.]
MSTNCLLSFFLEHKIIYINLWHQQNLISISFSLILYCALLFYTLLQ